MTKPARLGDRAGRSHTENRFKPGRDFSMRVGRQRALALLFVVVLAAFGRDARADAFTDALAGFAKDSYTDTIAAIEKLSVLGDPRAAPVLRALGDGNLY